MTILGLEDLIDGALEWLVRAPIQATLALFLATVQAYQCAGETEEFATIRLGAQVGACEYVSLGFHMQAMCLEAFYLS